MFGYIKPNISQLKICDYELYRSSYCGLCNSLKNYFGFTSRFTLSYDFVFYLMINMGVNDINIELTKSFCPLSPFKKHFMLKENNASIEACSSAILLLNAQCEDNIHDKKFFKKIPWIIFKFIISKSTKKIKNNNLELYSEINKYIHEQYLIEKKEDSNIDELCNPTANFMSYLFSSISNDKKNKLILSRFGYMLGRYIYLCDAIDDINRDKKDKSFNFILRDKISFDDFENIINFSISEVQKAYDLLNINYFKDILDNIVYIGLKSNSDTLIQRRKNS